MPEVYGPPQPGALVVMPGTTWHGRVVRTNRYGAVALPELGRVGTTTMHAVLHVERLRVGARTFQVAVEPRAREAADAILALIDADPETVQAVEVL